MTTDFDLSDLLVANQLLDDRAELDAMYEANGYLYFRGTLASLKTWVMS